MKNIYSYNSLENMYSDFLCLVDKMKLFNFLNEIIKAIDMDFEITETEECMVVIFSNGKKLKVYDEFIFNVSNDFEIDIAEDGVIEKIIEAINPQSISQKDKIEFKTKLVEDDNIISNVCKNLCIEDCMGDQEFYDMIKTKSDICEEFNKLSLEEQYRILIYLAYINYNVDLDLKLKFRKTYVGLFDEEERKFYCMILFSRNVLRIDGEDRLYIDNLTKYDIDQCFGFNGVPIKRNVISTHSNKPKEKSTTSRYGISKNYLFLGDEDEICPMCGDYLIVKNGRRGKFYSCSSYPSCTYSRDYDEEDRCPWCGDRLELKHGKYGMFYGCIMYPRCRYTRDV